VGQRIEDRTLRATIAAAVHREVRQCRGDPRELRDPLLDLGEMPLDQALDLAGRPLPVLPQRYQGLDLLGAEPGCARGG
jgi:hypothetical protein